MPLNAVPEAMLTMRPLFFSIITGATALAHWNEPRTFTFITRSHSSSSMSMNGFMARSANKPALSTREDVDGAELAHRIGDQILHGRFGSHIGTHVDGLVPPLSSRSASGPPSSTSDTTTLAPASANPSQKAAPMPRAPPVTMATLSLSLELMCSFPRRCRFLKSPPAARKRRLRLVMVRQFRRGARQCHSGNRPARSVCFSIVPATRGLPSLELLSSLRGGLFGHGKLDREAQRHRDRR